jgi:hypothetical protein
LFDTYYAENLEVHDYLHLVSQEMRKCLGQYITPSVIVKYILDAVGYREEADILDRRLADPACGSGIFLVEAIRAYLAALRRADVPIEAWYPQVLSVFVGLDVDPVACLYARFNLSLLLTPAILFWADTHPGTPLPLLPVDRLDTLRAVALELGPPRFFSYNTSPLRLRDSFDFVVGNPPYYKIGRLDTELKEIFQASLYGHPNAYALFLHTGLEMLRSGGVLGYIVPRSMLSSRTHRLVNKGLNLLAQRVTADEQPHRLVACIPESFCMEHVAGYFVENHLNVIQPRPDAPPIDLYYLLGILCSDVIEFFFRTMNGNTQVSATELNLMPIPRCDQEPQIAALARRLQDTPDPVARVPLEQRLNEQVTDAYGLTPDELHFIQKTLAENHSALEHLDDR